ncbi:MAG: sialidase family protein [Candidatus Brocadiaceae bacterium]
MKKHNVLTSLIIGSLLFVASSHLRTHAAQTNNTVAIPANNLEHLDLLANTGKAIKEGLGENANLLSSGSQWLIGFGQKWDEIRPAVQSILEKNDGMRKPLKPRASRLSPGNDVDADFAYSRIYGQCQTEPSSAWWGESAVVAFFDAGSYVRTALVSPSPSPSMSFSSIGWCWSGNASKAAPLFKDMGPLLPDPIDCEIILQDLTGNPVVAAAGSPSGSSMEVPAPAPRFYICCMSYLLKKFVRSAVTMSGISVLQSTDGGKTFGGAVPAAAKNYSTLYNYGGFLLDMPHMAVVPGANANKDTIHIVYTVVNVYYSSVYDQYIEYVKSTDGGKTWTIPVAVANFGYGGPLAQGAKVAVAPNGTIYVGWEDYDTFPCGNRHIRMKKSIDGGVSFVDTNLGTSNLVADVMRCGNGTLGQGNFHNPVDIGGVAVDPKNSNTVYVVWQDGKDKSVPDLSGCLDYHFSNIYFTRSLDGGMTWSAPDMINSDKPDALIDQFQPSIVVEKKTGRLYTNWNDRRKDKRNFLFEAYGAFNPTGAPGNWSMQGTITKEQSPPLNGGSDPLVPVTFMGYYSTPCADGSGKNPGVIAPYGDYSGGDGNVEIQKVTQLP